MRLLNSKTKQLELLHHRPVRYAIVSHRWGADSDEVLFTDIGDLAEAEKKRKGYDKIVGSCDQAGKDGLDYVWLDTCCIDKSNSTELGEAINSMYKWYRKSEVCYAYLHDVSKLSEFTESDWFKRGWTLQELIAPKVLKFYSKNWDLIGTREDLMDQITTVTGISPGILRSGKIPKDLPISQRMFWAAKRETKRVEDRAYSLLGILDVNLPANYGIDDAAFEDLQHRVILKYADQTLFAWYYNVPEPQDIEMADASLALDPVPDPAPDVAPDSVSESDEGEKSTPSYYPTGFLAHSPSPFLQSYEISEDDFRTIYVDRIRDISYRANFVVMNNHVRITLPVKHIKGKLWKAVLRCSFEPPGGEKSQIPLVIYLEETGPWKYTRVHLARNEIDEEGEDEDEDEQTDEEIGVPGSLERLTEAEHKLDGYMLREIDVLCRYGEDPSDEQPKQPATDPDALPEVTEAERIAQLPRHPPGVKTTNIIACGEPGVAAGRVINLITGDTIIKPLTDYDREAMAVTVIDTTLQSRNIRIFYTIGPRDPFLDLEIYQTVIRNMYELVQQAKAAGGIHLIMLCMVGSRVTRAVETNYRLFREFICDGRVPVILIVTGLGKTKRMEDWWDAHQNDPAFKSMFFHDHACITVLQGEDEEHERKYKESGKRVQGLLTDFIKGLETMPEVYCPEDGAGWFVSMGKRTRELLLRGLNRSLKQESVEKALKEGLSLSEAEVGNLACQFFD